MERFRRIVIISLMLISCFGVCSFFVIKYVFSFDVQPSNDDIVLIDSPGNSKQGGNESRNCPYEYDSLAKMKVYTFVDKQPAYPGGSPALLNFIAKNFHYPEQDVFQASFQIQFVIDEHGSVLAARIKEKKQGELTLAEQELLKAIYKMPKWNVGKCEGRNVPVKITLPLYL